MLVHNVVLFFIQLVHFLSQPTTALLNVLWGGANGERSIIKHENTTTLHSARCYIHTHTAHHCTQKEPVHNSFNGRKLHWYTEFVYCMHSWFSSLWFMANNGIPTADIILQSTLKLSCSMWSETESYAEHCNIVNNIVPIADFWLLIADVQRLCFFCFSAWQCISSGLLIF